MSDRNRQVVDLLVVGGGINGVGIARDAAGRGLNVVLCEKGDLGGATSWTSSKLIHGGLRYLEHYEFRLVHESLAEREVLLRVAPHLVRPLRFVLPHVSALRPAWMIRAGLFLYDHLSRRVSLPGSSWVNLRRSPFGAGLKPAFRTGFSYFDCRVDDARLVIATARAAAARGARVLARTRCVGARTKSGLWLVDLEERDSGARTTVGARVLVNAAGPWVVPVRTSIKGATASRQVRLIKGSHIVVPRVYEGEHAFILQNDDGRVVFVIPFEGQSLIGTTEVEIADIPPSLDISEDEVDYLCRAVGRYLAHPVTPNDVLWSFAGLRPLFGDADTSPSEITRDYELDLDVTNDGAPVLHVYGGKITTYRRLAERVLARLKPYLPYMKGPWTEEASLPGGDVPGGDLAAFVDTLARARPALPRDLLTALTRRHGTLSAEVLADAQDTKALGSHFGADLYAREVDYFMEREWARSAEDVLWRRTKVGLHLSTQQRTSVSEYMEQHLRPASVQQLQN
ncbi:MAG: glycerol-3-phosphate dehydrogenase [Acidiferrobacterales bacterium]|nr:glycerol-3-phosphate dehydrogenase [Acidiferrobacterales bacterium]